MNYEEWFEAYGHRPEFAWSDPRYTFMEAVSPEPPPLGPPVLNDYNDQLFAYAPLGVPFWDSYFVASDKRPFITALADKEEYEEYFITLLEAKLSQKVFAERKSVIVGPRYWWWSEQSGNYGRVVNCRAAVLVHGWAEPPDYGQTTLL